MKAAHIHVGALPGAEARARWGFFATPVNDIHAHNHVVTPFATGVGRIFSSVWDAPECNVNCTGLASQLSGIFSGLAYINFHTNQFPGGEIRGQLTVPAPATLLLLGSGLVSALALARTR